MARLPELEFGRAAWGPYQVHPSPSFWTCLSFCLGDRCVHGSVFLQISGQRMYLCTLVPYLGRMHLTRGGYEFLQCLEPTSLGTCLYGR